eukprot:6180834-Pleurochrysis_carterae.AAC.2
MLLLTIRTICPLRLSGRTRADGEAEQFRTEQLEMLAGSLGRVCPELISFTLSVPTPPQHRKNDEPRVDHIRLP